VSLIILRARSCYVVTCPAATRSHCSGRHGLHYV